MPWKEGYEWRAESKQGTVERLGHIRKMEQGWASNMNNSIEVTNGDELIDVEAEKARSDEKDLAVESQS